MGGRGGRSHRAVGGFSRSGYNFIEQAAFEALRKQSALDFASRFDADAEHRPVLDALWDGLSLSEKYAIWQYTSGSGGFNRPLSGYKGTWSNFVGQDNVKWGQENQQGWLSGPFEQATGSSGIRYDRAIVDLTNAIEKSSLPKDTYLVRGSDSAGLAGMLRETIGFDQTLRLLSSGTEEQVQRALVGKTAQSHGFVSTAVAKDAGFTGNIKYRIYAPKGTKAIYAEPQSAYGDTISGESFYQKGMRYYGIGGEAEMIVQRGTQFRITNITSTGYGGYRVDMEVIAQPKFKKGKEKTR